MARKRVITFAIEIQPPAAPGAAPTARIEHVAGAARGANAEATRDLTADIGEALGRITERHEGKPLGAGFHVHTDANGVRHVHKNH